MSSRLFQEVREKRGLVYSIYSFASGMADHGLFGIRSQRSSKGDIWRARHDSNVRPLAPQASALSN